MEKSRGVVEGRGEKKRKLAVAMGTILLNHCFGRIATFAALFYGAVDHIVMELLPCF